MAGLWTVVVAAGAGSRFGGPKQDAMLGDRTVLARSIEAARAASGGGVVVVVPGDEDLPRSAGALMAVDAVAVGGRTRAASVRAGLALVPRDASLVAVHDAARPLASPRLWDEGARAVLEGAAGAVPAVAVTDTLKSLDGTEVGATLDRAGLVAVQTPQVFDAAALRRAHAGLGEATDDAGLVEASGGTVVVVEGEASNMKITTRQDLEMASALIGGRPARVGHGFDSHGPSDDDERPLVLGGVVFEGERGLAGHSDSDAVAHAIADALLAASGLDDLGTRYPDDDPTWAGADSMDLLARCVSDAESAGWRPSFVDCTVVAERPRIGPRRAEMVLRLGRTLGCDVGIKGKSPEALDGHGPGTVAVTALATMVPVDAGPASA